MRIITLFLLMVSFGAQAGTFQLDWTNSVTRVDGTPIALIDIWYTKVQCGTSPGVYTPALDITISKATDGSLSSTTAVTVPDDGSTYYCSVFHAGMKGDDSGISNEVSIGPGLSPIAPPGSLTVTTTTTTVITP